jgi:zinc transport system substrate-binding protein
MPAPAPRFFYLPFTLKVYTSLTGSAARPSVQRTMHGAPDIVKRSMPLNNKLLRAALISAALALMALSCYGSAPGFDLHAHARADAAPAADMTNGDALPDADDGSDDNAAPAGSSSSVDAATASDDALPDADNGNYDNAAPTDSAGSSNVLGNTATAGGAALPDASDDASPSASAANTDSSPSSDVQRVYASVAPVYALAEGLLRGVDGFDLRQLTQPQLDCARLYELSDWDMVQLSTSQLCIIWGQGLESYSGTLTSAQTGPAVITLEDDARDFAALDEELADYDQYGHFSGIDPHSYLSFGGMRDALDALCESMQALYPAHADEFAQNAARMRAQLDRALAEVRPNAAPDERIAVLTEGAPYMLEELGMSWTYVYPREPASDVTHADLDELLARLNASDVSAVLIERQAPAALRQALEQAGHSVRQVSTLMTLNAPTFEEYLAALQANARAALGA